VSRWRLVRGRLRRGGARGGRIFSVVLDLRLERWGFCCLFICFILSY
jgi:hypothetical protein